MGLASVRVSTWSTYVPMIMHEVGALLTLKCCSVMSAALTNKMTNVVKKKKEREREISKTTESTTFSLVRFNWI